MACHDSQGRYVLEACRQAGLNVPEDVAIIGVDNDELMCELAVPPLSSVAHATEQIGFQAVELLDTLMTGHRRRPVHITVPPACLVTRQSSDIVAIDDEVVSRATEFIRENATELVASPMLPGMLACRDQLWRNASKARLGARFTMSFRRDASASPDGC